MLGIREPEIYGKESYADLCKKIEAYANARGVKVEIYQSNHEGALVDCIQEAYGKIDGIGTHSQLLHSCETYREIAVSQLSEKELGLEVDA